MLDALAHRLKDIKETRFVLSRLSSENTFARERSSSGR